MSVKNLHIANGIIFIGVICISMVAAIFSSAFLVALNVLCAVPVMLFTSGGSFFLWLHIRHMNHIKTQEELKHYREKYGKEKRA